MLNRRNFLLRGCAGLGSAAGFATNLASFNAHAADVSDYKALVCVFLRGAMDSHDTLIPYDVSSNRDYEAIREPILTALDSSVDGTSRRRNSLLRLGGAGGNVGGRRFAFPEEFRPLHELYEQGTLSVVGNVGPLVEPTTRESFLSGAARLPPRLFSHNDQQSVWMASQPEGARSGWGGRFADVIDSANSASGFTTVSAAGSSVFLTGENVRSFQVSRRGALRVDNLRDRPVNGSSTFHSTLADILRDTGNRRSGLFAQDYVKAMQASLDNNALLEAQFDLPGGPTTIFPATSLGEQLNVVANIIARREGFGLKRQVFFVATGGFDTHSAQAVTLPGLQANIANSMRAFHDSMVELGINEKVTAFTASDFGRTLGVNGDGTDHGWGGHHVVVGGAVNGRQIIGDIPPAAFNHSQDAGRGRLIPETSVDQYAGALGRWFGLNDSELIDALPGLQNFDTTALNGLFL